MSVERKPETLHEQNQYRLVRYGRYGSQLAVEKRVRDTMGIRGWISCPLTEREIMNSSVMVGFLKHLWKTGQLHDSEIWVSSNSLLRTVMLYKSESTRAVYQLNDRPAGILFESAVNNAMDGIVYVRDESNRYPLVRVLLAWIDNNYRCVQPLSRTDHNGVVVTIDPVLNWNDAALMVKEVEQ